MYVNKKEQKTPYFSSEKKRSVARYALDGKELR